MFDELFPNCPPAPYQQDAENAGFRLVTGDVGADPDGATLEPVLGVICNCMIGAFRGRRVAVFEDVFLGAHHRAIVLNIAFDIRNHDFRSTPGLGSYWSIRRTDDWVYFTAPVEFNRYPNFNDFLRDTNEIFEMYLL
jgi:hypothetical protein